MYEARLTLDNGVTQTQAFADYSAMVAWIAEQPQSGIMVWQDGEGIENLVQLLRDVEALQA